MTLGLKVWTPLTLPSTNMFSPEQLLTAIRSDLSSFIFLHTESRWMRCWKWQATLEVIAPMNSWRNKGYCSYWVHSQYSYASMIFYNRLGNIEREPQNAFATNFWPWTGKVKLPTSGSRGGGVTGCSAESMDRKRNRANKSLNSENDEATGKDKTIQNILINPK